MLAHLVERDIRIVEVRSSSLLHSTKYKKVFKTYFLCLLQDKNHKAVILIPARARDGIGDTVEHVGFIGQAGCIPVIERRETSD